MKGVQKNCEGIKILYLLKIIILKLPFSKLGNVQISYDGFF